MKSIKNLTSAWKTFEEAANMHALATEQGDYKSANKNYDIVVKIITYLKDNNAIDKLLIFLNNPSIGVRMAAATYLLPKYENEGLKTLDDIRNSKGIHSLTASTIINEWENGNLKL